MLKTTSCFVLVLAMAISGMAVAADKYGTTKSTAASSATGKNTSANSKKCVAQGRTHPVGTSMCLDGSTTKCEQDGWKDQHQKCN
jgi:uncharacterized protein YdeI (BOF family)